MSDVVDAKPQYAHMFSVHIVEETRNSPYKVSVIMALIYSRMRQFDRATTPSQAPGAG